jgi:hypothetical protein
MQTNYSQISFLFPFKWSHRKNQRFSQIVVTSPPSQNLILNSLHESTGHRGISKTYRWTKLRFWWSGLQRSAINWVQSCETFQKGNSTLLMEEMKATGNSAIFGRFSLDTVHIKAGK